MAGIPSEALEALESSGMFEAALNPDPEGPERKEYRSAPPSPTTSEELNLDDWDGSGDEDYTSKIGAFRSNKSKIKSEDAPVYVPDHGGAQTGIKGVIADAKASKDSASMSAESNMTRARAAYLAAGKLGKTYQEEEDEFRAIEAYRAGRMREIAGRSVFRKVKEVNAGELHKILENEGDVSRVVHIQVEGHQPCLDINKHIRVLAVAFPHTQFLAIDANDIEFTSGGLEVLPTLLIYQGGDLTSTIIRAQDETEGTLDGLAQILISKGALREYNGTSKMEIRDRRTDSESDKSSDSD